MKRFKHILALVLAVLLLLSACGTVPSDPTNTNTEPTKATEPSAIRPSVDNGTLVFYGLLILVLVAALCIVIMLILRRKNEDESDPQENEQEQNEQEESEPQ